jgi:hypothetical protein
MHGAAKELSVDSIALTVKGNKINDDAKILAVIDAEGLDTYATEVEKRFKCGNVGCTKEFTEKENSDTACQFHPGNPKFHEGNKGYDCCWKKRVISFDEFLNLPGCSIGRHKKYVKPAETPKPTASKIDNVPVELEKTTNADGKEVYRPAGQASNSAAKPKEAPKPPVEIPDPENAVIPIGAPCLHQGCSASYKDASSRAEECVYHAGSPIFHEGSKGWQCCKGFTLIFEDFLNAPGCTKGKHKFVPEVKKVDKVIRRDFYQMGSFVVVNFYERNVNKEKSTVKFDSRSFLLALECADGTKYEELVQLSNEIVPELSLFSILGPKVELKLQKKAASEWTKL